MYSQCPDCQTRFRVTAAMLRAAHGTVRCGRCGSAFDALERLSDTVPPPTPVKRAVPVVVAPETVSGTGSTTGTEYHFSAEDLERVFVEASDWRDPFASQLAAADTSSDSVPAGTESPSVLVDENAGVEDITLEGERVRIEALPEEARAEFDLDSTDELEILRHVPDSAYPEDEDEVEREIEALAQQLRAEPTPPPEPVAAPAAPGTLPRHEEAVEPVAAVAAAPTSTGPVSLSAQRWRRPVEEAEPEPVRPSARWNTLGWTLGSLLLALTLAAQVVHHFRQDLVRHPQLGPPLRAAYERLGLSLSPNWDLGAIELRQWGNDADAAARGRMVVRASLTNRAAFAQPHPILRLELEDRFGNTVATRDFEPADYLKNPSQATRLMAPGASSEAELVLADPGRDAVGYRLDICLRESASLLRCAGGAS